MKYRKIFSPDSANPLLISKIGFGTGAGFDTKFASQEELIQRLSRAYELGINWFDTAEQYSGGMAEEILGKALSKNQGAFFFTKFSPINSSAKKIRSALEGSLKRLKRDHIDLYQMHWPQTCSDEYDEILNQIEIFQKEGKIVRFGVCNFNSTDFEKIKNNRLKLISSNQVEYNLFNREHDLLKNKFQNNNIFTIAYGVLEGLKRGQRTNDTSSLLLSLAKKYSASESQIILSWILAKDFFAITTSSIRERVISNIASVDLQLDGIDLARIDELYQGNSRDIDLSLISISQEYIGDKQYFSLNEALENKFGFTPSPFELARSYNPDNYFRPIKVIKFRDGFGINKFKLVGGAVRYWAYQIAFPSIKTIPAFIIN